MDIKTCRDCGHPQTLRAEQRINYKYVKKEPAHWQGKCNWCKLYKIGVCDSLPSMKFSEYEWQITKLRNELAEDV